MEDEDAYLSPTKIIWSLLGSPLQPALPLSNQPTPVSTASESESEERCQVRVAILMPYIHASGYSRSRLPPNPRCFMAAYVRLTGVSVVETTEGIMRLGMQNKVWHILRYSSKLKLYLLSRICCVAV